MSAGLSHCVAQIPGILCLQTKGKMMTFIWVILRIICKGPKPPLSPKSDHQPRLLLSKMNFISLLGCLFIIQPCFSEALGVHIMQIGQSKSLKNADRPTNAPKSWSLLGVFAVFLWSNSDIQWPIKLYWDEGCHFPQPKNNYNRKKNFFINWILIYSEYEERPNKSGSGMQGTLFPFLLACGFGVCRQTAHL